MGCAFQGTLGTTLMFAQPPSGSRHNTTTELAVGHCVRRLLHRYILYCRPLHTLHNFPTSAAPIPALRPEGTATHLQWHQYLRDRTANRLPLFYASATSHRKALIPIGVRVVERHDNLLIGTKALLFGRQPAHCPETLNVDHM